MKTINLRWIYPHYRHDEFVEVSDEVWEVMRQAQREMNNYERRKVYHRAWGTLWTHIAGQRTMRWNTAGSPEEILLEREERAAHLRLLARLAGGPVPCHSHPRPAASGPTTSPVSASREISRREGVDSSKVSVAIRRGPAEYAPDAMTAFSRQSEGGPYADHQPQTVLPVLHRGHLCGGVG